MHFMRGSRDSRDSKLSRILENLHSEDEWSSEMIQQLGPQLVRDDPVRSPIRCSKLLSRKTTWDFIRGRR